MRTPHSSVRFICVLTLAILSGCAGATQKDGFAPGLTANSSHSSQKTGVAPSAYTGARDLYVADAQSNSVKILKNGSYAELGQITNGISTPQSVFLDKHGNLYVVNFGAGNVTEYAPNGTTPIFTYNDQLSEPTRVAADAHGNVFVSDQTDNNIRQYSQQSNTVAAKCSQGNFILGIAVDSNNDVFLSSASGQLVEYPGGLAGCNATVLGVTIPGASFGITVDKQSDLVVSNTSAGTIEVIAPPYSSVTRTFGTSLVEPVNVTLNKDNKLAFVVDWEKDVQVYNFSTGTLVKTLGTPYGLVNPFSAVDGPNAVY